MTHQRLEQDTEQERVTPPREADVREAAGVADLVVAEVGPDARRLEELADLARKYRASRFWWFVRSVLPVVVLGEAAVVAIGAALSPIIGPDVAAGVGAATMAAAVVPTVLTGLKRSGRRTSAQLKGLVHGQGVAAIPALLDLLRADLHPGRNRWSPLLDVLSDILAEALPELRASDALLLEDRHRRTLNEVLARAIRYLTWPGMRWLAWRRARLFRPALIVAILRALEQVGDESAIPFVEKLAGLPPDTAARREVREAAERCLPLLRVSSGKVEAARTLLRPSEPTPAEGLLRPVDCVPAFDPDRLVRPSEPAE